MQQVTGADAQWAAVVEHSAADAPRVAVVLEADCIGCTKCLKACPLDAIVGANGMLHAVLARSCVGCDLCVAVCPTDCITLNARPVGERGPALSESRLRFERRRQRLQSAPAPGTALVALAPFDKAALQSAVHAAVARHRRRRDHA